MSKIKYTITLHFLVLILLAYSVYYFITFYTSCILYAHKEIAWLQKERYSILV